MRISKLCYLGFCSIALTIGLLSCTEEPAIVAVTSVTLDSTSLTLVEGDNQTLTATVSPSNAENQKVLWSSSNSSVASVKEGVVTALKAGNATITAKTDDGGKTATCTVIVEAKNIPVTGVTLDKTSYEMAEGDEITLTATVNPENATNKNISWSSSNTSVVSVDNGKVKALKAGTATITVKTEDGNKTAICEIIVIAKVYPVESISLNCSSLELNTGDQYSLIATIYPSNATNKAIIWTCSNESVITVSNGNINALNAGTATISATTEDGGKIATCDVVVYDGVVFLSTNGTANCYIVSEAGTYRFTPTKGNSTESVGAISSVEVLWETFGTSKKPNVGDLVNYVKYENKGITFATPDNFKKGNAVIAARDASGNILWSWHIWFTDPIKEQEYYHNAGIMMDRNLGATVATVGSAQAFGLLYQWGRKDPFLSAISISSSSTEARSTINWPSSVALTADTGTIEYTILHPTTYILSNYSINDDYDWCIQNSSSNGSPRWTTSETAKSIYDPCPVGWRIPDGGENGIWAKAVANPSLQYHPYDKTNRGMDFAGKFGPDSSIWYPCAPDRDDTTGKLSGGGYGGSVWSASQEYSRPIVLFFNYQEYLEPSHGGYGANGFSVRCSRE